MKKSKEDLVQQKYRETLHTKNEKTESSRKDLFVLLILLFFIILSVTFFDVHIGPEDSLIKIEQIRL